PGAARGQPNAKSAFADWAHGLEAAHDFVLFVGSDSVGAWNEHCLRQADMVLIVGDAGRAPDHGPGTLPAWLNASLILLQNGGTRHTLAWLEAYPGAVHFNVRLPVAVDFDRVARLVTGRGVGLVLGGGGARGMAHIGVIKALAEAGIPIDRIGG